MIDQDVRTVLIAYLAERAPAKWIGRTALMKYCYFLQVLRDVPLGYNFSLYSYGPFDSAVLSDLGDAEALGVVQETTLSTGYGYKIENALNEEDLKELAGAFLGYKDDVSWVMQEFGTESTADLELDSTIVFVDREAAETKENLSKDLLVLRVRDVKPRFTESKIHNHVQKLQQKGLLLALNR